MRDPADEAEEYYERQEAARAEKLDEQVALAERNAPEELIELNASMTKSQFLEVMTERAMERLFGRYGNRGLEDEVRKHIHALVEREAKETIERVLEEHVAAATALICETGFQETDNYGRPRGERKTISAFVIEYLNGHVDEYGRHSNSGKERIFQIADKLVGVYLEKEIKPQLEKLKKRCEEALDNSVASRIKEAVISGLGLR